MHEELQDGAQSMEAMTTAGMASVMRIDADVQRAAAASAPTKAPQAGK
jgi:hypothetical protein